jgi:hypothetical protein
MLTDPVRFFLLLSNTAQRISAMEDYLRGFTGPCSPAPEAGQVSARARFAARLAGALIVACAFAHLAGLAR